MREILHYSPKDQPEDILDHSYHGTEKSISMLGGRYHDPSPKLVAYLNERFKEPGENVAANLMKSLELAGVVKTVKEIKEMTQPLELSGLLPMDAPEGQLPEYSVNPDGASDFTDLRDEQLLLELQEGNDVRNNLLIRVREMVALRNVLNEAQESELWAFGRSYTQAHEIPPALKILRVMVGIYPPEDPKNNLVSVPPELTRDLAPDVYWMMLRGEDQAEQKIIDTAA